MLLCTFLCLNIWICTILKLYTAKGMKQSAAHLSTQGCIQHSKKWATSKQFFVAMITTMIIGVTIMELDCISEERLDLEDMVHLGICKEERECWSLLCKIHKMLLQSKSIWNLGLEKRMARLLINKNRFLLFISISPIKIIAAVWNLKKYLF